MVKKNSFIVPFLDTSKKLLLKTQGFISKNSNLKAYFRGYNLKLRLHNTCFTAMGDIEVFTIIDFGH